MSASRRCSLHRRPRTAQELRENLDCEVPVRGKRRKLPTAWDDLSFSKAGDRSWKRHRTTQHKN